MFTYKLLDTKNTDTKIGGVCGVIKITRTE